MSIKSWVWISALSLVMLTGCGSDNNKKTSSSSSSSSSSNSSSSSSEVSSSDVSSSLASSSTSSLASVQLTGTAAVGAAIVNANVIAKCADGSGFIDPVKTNAQGVFTGLVAQGALPCALQVNGGTPAVVLHSYSASAGTINITPLTDLILANATNQLPVDWFANPDWANITNTITTAQAEIKTALTTAGYNIPSGNFTPFSTPFSIGDDWDQLLDQIQLAIDESVTIENYLALVALIQGGNLASFPSAGQSSSSSSSISSVNSSSTSSSTSSSSSSSSSSLSSSSAGGSGNGASCYNPVLTQTGTRVINKYRTTKAAAPVLEFVYDQTVKGQTTFNGQTALHAVSTTEAVGAAPSNSTTTAYFTKDDANQRSTTLGVKVVVTSPITITTTVTNNPGRLTRFDLAVNESYSQTIAISTDIASSFSMPPSSPVNADLVTTFLGIESITVPAGTYDACRFESKENGEKTTRWFAVDKGTELRVESGGDVTVYVSGTLNGVAQ